MSAGIARKSFFGLLAGLVAIFVATVALADSTTTIDVAVDVKNLPDRIDSFTVACFVCVGECPEQDSYTPFSGATATPVDPRAHGFTGNVTVVVPNNDKHDHDNFLCRLELQSNNSFPYIAGLGPKWTLPGPGTEFVNIISGPLPLCDAGQVSDDMGKCITPVKVAKPRSCPSGQTRVNGVCVCPDGKQPVNGSCQAPGQAGLPSNQAPDNNPNPLDIFKLFPCPNNGVKQADGSCAPAAANNGNSKLNGKLKLIPRCADGSLPGKDGCPAAPKFRLLLPRVTQP